MRTRGSACWREIGNLLPNNRRQRRTCYALCHLLYPVSAAQTSIFRMDSNSTSYCGLGLGFRALGFGFWGSGFAHIREIFEGFRDWGLGLGV